MSNCSFSCLYECYYQNNFFIKYNLFTLQLNSRNYYCMWSYLPAFHCHMIQLNFPLWELPVLLKFSVSFRTDFFILMLFNLTILFFVVIFKKTYATAFPCLSLNVLAGHNQCTSTSQSSAGRFLNRTKRIANLIEVFMILLGVCTIL